ncbi:MAG: Ig-like domain-containing protein, partial [Bacilli bacterium]|nr:Ig-like domain-containing protein [Bacilli bacterium]
MKTKNKFNFIVVFLLAFVALFMVGCDETEEEDPVYTIELNSSEKTLEVEEVFTLIASTFVDGESVEGEVTWTSSVSGIVSLEDGIVTALAEGNTTITATYKGKTATCIITVTKPDEEVFLILS